MCLLKGVERADWLGGIFECWIAWVDLDMRDDAHDQAVSLTHLVEERCFDEVADQALSHRAEGAQRLTWHESLGLVLLDGKIANLGPVPVGDDDPPSGLAHLGDGLHHRLAVGQHLVVGSGLPLEGDGIATERDHSCTQAELGCHGMPFAVGAHAGDYLHHMTYDIVSTL